MDVVRVVVVAAQGARLELLTATEDLVYLLKCRISRKLGIPVSQQHLMYNFRELSNSSSLNSYSIKDGSVLKLVVSLKNGLASHCGRAISTYDHIQWTDLKHYMENQRDDTVDWLHVGYNDLADNDDEESNTHKYLPESTQNLHFPGIPLTEEDCVTKCKMMDVQCKMRELSIKRYESEFQKAMKDYFDDDYPAGSCPMGDRSVVESLFRGVRDFHGNPVKNVRESIIQKLPNLSYDSDDEQADNSCDQCFSECYEDQICDDIEKNSFKINRMDMDAPNTVVSIKDSKDTRTFLPPIETKIKDKGKRHVLGKSERVRCFMCKKRLSIATIHNCQCGLVFCAPHRYSEVHNCKYDYSKEWQTQLHRANPPSFILPKIPKI